MGNLFLKTVFSYLMILFLIVNISYTFDLVGQINPTSLAREGGYSDYYFGFSNILEGFQSMTTSDTLLFAFNTFLNNFGSKIQELYSFYTMPFQLVKGSWGELLGMIFAIINFTNQIIPIIMMIFYGICFIIYILVYAFTIILFIMRMMGGYYVTPLPSTDWWDYQSSELIQSFKAIMV